jgi:hypothetical protein
MYDLNNLRVGDRLVRGKGLLSKQYGIYVGYHSGQHLIAENDVQRGVCYGTFVQFLENNRLERIEHFRGSERERRKIVPFLEDKIGTNYDLSNYNAEYYVNEAETNKVESPKLYRAIVLGVLEYVWYRALDLQE